LQAAEIGQDERCGLCARQRRSSLSQKHPSFICQLYAASDAMEKLDTIGGLEIADSRTDGRWREPDRKGGFGQMLAFGNRYENGKLFKRH
jgi:hypothetical protein